jgi:hypothetical protein
MTNKYIYIYKYIIDLKNMIFTYVGYYINNYIPKNLRVKYEILNKKEIK